MKNLFLSAVIILFCTAAAISANEPEGSGTGLSFASSGTLFHPFRANALEPRVGIRELTDHSSLRLDIGNSLDILRYAPDAGSPVYECGVDFFTFTRLRSEANFHFPVDAVDYLFGFNAAMKDTLQSGILSARLRMSHISAHMVDGHFDNFAHIWKDDRSPIIYSREFTDLAVAFEPAALHGALRVYAGGVYIYHIDPTSLGRTSWYGGAEYRRPLTAAVSFYAAYQPTLVNISGWTVRHEVESGIHLGIINGRGMNIYWAFFSGKSIHGEYHDVQENYGAIGIGFDL